MWTRDDGLTFYGGERRAGTNDRAATGPELAAIAFAKVKQAKAAAILAAFNAAALEGVPYGGKVLQIREQDRPNVTAVFARAMASLLGAPGITWPENGHPFRMLDNSVVLFTQQDFIAMALLAADRVTALRLNLGALNDALVAATTIPAVAAIDANSGWSE